LHSAIERTGGERESERENRRKGRRGEERERERAQHEREGVIGLERVCAPKRTRGRDRERETGNARSSETSCGKGGESENEILRRSIRHQLKLQ